MKKYLVSMIIVLSILVTGCVGSSKSKDVGSKDIKSTKIQFIRNATMRINYGGKLFLTDPMLSEKETLPGFLYTDRLANPTSALPIKKEEILKDIEAVFVSHTHIPAEDVDGGPSDHFDSVAVETIDKNMPIYVQAYDAPGLKRLGFKAVNAIKDSITVDDITLTRIVGKHTDIDALLPMVGESSGYILQSQGYPTIYWTGDTLLTEEVKDAIVKYNPDIIITHSGGAQLPIDDKGNVAKLVMDGDDTIEIAQLAPKAKIIAIHFEALDHCPVTRKSLREKVKSLKISQERFFIPEDGDKLSF